MTLYRLMMGMVFAGAVWMASASAVSFVVGAEAWVSIGFFAGAVGLVIFVLAGWELCD